MDVHSINYVPNLRRWPEIKVKQFPLRRAGEHEAGSSVLFKSKSHRTDEVRRADGGVSQSRRAARSAGVRRIQGKLDAIREARERINSTSRFPRKYRCSAHRTVKVEDFAFAYYRHAFVTVPRS
ncbi:hypothetical protein EVAR_49830_1 [Eumeta japonica]|uniref:Uncharacterized protein n=1 Tax=Eumeta variegata TaxID=151549 RepID=A0A4C1Z248_EUMVA|nr:hypothetical protein EVAR_49830_1 [Eumeta japonica]